MSVSNASSNADLLSKCSIPSIWEQNNSLKINVDTLTLILRGEIALAGSQNKNFLPSVNFFELYTDESDVIWTGGFLRALVAIAERCDSKTGTIQTGAFVGNWQSFRSDVKELKLIIDNKHQYVSQLTYIARVNKISPMLAHTLIQFAALGRLQDFVHKSSNNYKGHIEVAKGFYFQIPNESVDSCFQHTNMLWRIWRVFNVLATSFCRENTHMSLTDNPNMDFAKFVINFHVITLRELMLRELKGTKEGDLYYDRITTPTPEDLTAYPSVMLLKDLFTIDLPHNSELPSLF